MSVRGSYTKATRFANSEFKPYRRVTRTVYDLEGEITRIELITRHFTWRGPVVASVGIPRGVPITRLIYRLQPARVAPGVSLAVLTPKSGDQFLQLRIFGLNPKGARSIGTETPFGTFPRHGCDRRAGP